MPSDIHPPNIGVWQSGYITHGPTFEQWCSYVELPRGYSVLCMYIDQSMQMWVMIVGSENLLDVDVHQKVPALKAEFAPTESGVRVVGKRRV